jgi:hypothetical protein
MKTKTTIILLVFLAVANAQDYRFGKVSKEELQKEKSTIDPESPAEILYEKNDVEFVYSEAEDKFYIMEEVEGRIKIYDKNNTPDEYLKKQVELYTPNSTREKITGFKGVTYNLENGKIEEYKVKGSSIFTEEVNKYWTLEKFAFENVKNGSVLEYKYTVQSPYTNEIDRWFFQHDIPTVHSELSFLRPEVVVYSPDERGEIRGKIKTERKPNPGFKFDNSYSTYVYENLKALKDEPFVFNPDNLKASVRFELMQLAIPGRINENFATSWSQIGKDLNQHSEIGGQLTGNNFLDETVQNLTSALPAPIEKMQAVFNFIKTNYTWNKYASIYADNGVRKTFNEKSGNAADINLLLTSMLQKAGIDARPVVLSTIDNLMINYTFPSKTSLNFLICGVDIQGKLYLLDATEKLSDINMLPLRDLNHRGFRILENGTIQEISLTNYSLSSDKEVIGVELNPDGTVSGTYYETKDQYFAMTDNIYRNKDPKEFQKEYLSDYAFDIDELKIDENPDKGLVRYSFKFVNAPGGEVIGNKILINPLLFTQRKEHRFKNDKRSYPLEFGTLISNSKTIKIKIPEGYKIESLPQAKQFVVEGSVAGYMYKAEEQNGYILLTTIYQIGQSILPSSYYQPMKEFDNQQIDTEDQQVVLVKI